MANLTTAAKARARQALALGAHPTWTKPQVAAALDAITARLDGAKATINSDIGAAAPGVFTVPQKLLLLTHAVEAWARAEGGR